MELKETIMANKAEIKFKDGHITTKFDIISLEENDKGGISCYIPAFDIYFSVQSESQIVKRGGNAVRAFFQFWLRREGQRKFFLELHKLGFRTNNHTAILKELLDGATKSVKFGFERDVIPASFKNATIRNSEAELMAI